MGGMDVGNNQRMNNGLLDNKFNRNEEPVDKMNARSPSVSSQVDPNDPTMTGTPDATIPMTNYPPAYIPNPHYLSELGYLFDEGAGQKINNQDNQNTIDGRINNAQLKGSGDTANGDYTVIFKGTSVNNSSQIVGHLKEKVNKTDNANPYATLIGEFGTRKAMRLKPSDFAYLTKLGVYPMNRLWILRRFGEQVTVPDNLEDWGKGARPSPMSTVIGWIEAEDTNFFSVDFNETWTKTTKMLHTMLLDIIKDEFGIKLQDAVPIPGWSRGVLFGFLNAMGIVSDWGKDEIPVGNPNVLKEGATRNADGPEAPFGLNSSIQVSLKTSYEMKFIGDVDPGSAMLDILWNLVYMGTSNTRFVMDANAEGMVGLIRAAVENNTIDAWSTMITTLFKAFISALQTVFKDAKELITGSSSGDGKDTSGKKEESKTADQDATADQEAAKAEATLKKETDVLDRLLNAGTGFLNSILASTIGTYRWALRGSIALMTGQNSTPWHLTIGNPFSPFVSMGNIVVDKVKLNFPNELSYNDMPSRVEVDITVRLGRNTGAQEIFRMFNNSYQRVYSAKKKAFLFRKN